MVAQIKACIKKNNGRSVHTKKWLIAKYYWEITLNMMGKHVCLKKNEWHNNIWFIS